MIGMWSYDVPEFEVQDIEYPKHFDLDRDLFVDDFDVIFWEDARSVGNVVGTANIPVVYMVVDSTLSQEHYEHRHTMASQADLIVVDWDRLERFQDIGVPVRRLSYCVNERLFHPYPKTVDVGFYCNMTDERAALNSWLALFCDRYGFEYDSGRREGPAYARALGSAKVNINLNRNPETRAHRSYDVMASQSCLVTSIMPPVSGETWEHGVHFLQWADYDDLAVQLFDALHDNRWQEIADTAFGYVTGSHVWALRAKQLYTILREEFPCLCEGK